MCRQQIIFDSCTNLLACVHMILSDTELLVIRVKNRRASGSAYLL